MKANLKTFETTTALVLLFFILISFGCKKNKEDVLEPSLVGFWGHVQETGRFSSKVTYLELKADGTGMEALMQNIGSSSTQVYEDALKWSTSGNSLRIQFLDGEIVEYTFSVDPENRMLLTDVAGDTREFFKNR